MRTRLVLTVLAVTLASQTADACKCGPAPAPHTITKPGAAVFSGRVLTSFELRFAFYAVVKVDRAWTGATYSTTLIRSDRGSCSWKPKGGDEFLFVADEGSLISDTGLCSGNLPLASAGASLAALGPGRAPVPIVVLYGPLVVGLLVGVVLMMRRLKKR